MHPIAGVVNQVVEVVDVDGVVRRIDVNDVVERIDVNNVVERIDVNRVLSRVDLNQFLSRVDWNEHLDKIDFDAIVKRVDTKSFIARSSTGVFTNFLDSVRTQVVMIDLYLMMITRCRFWKEHHRQNCYLPPKPGHRQRDDRQVYPRGRTNKAVAVQGRYCGFVSKTIALFVDVLTTMLLFSMVFEVIQWFLIVFLRETTDEASNATRDFQENSAFLVMILYVVLHFIYFFASVGLAGQTLGMLLVGLRVCSCNRNNAYSTVSLEQALVRTCLLPVTSTLCPPLGVIGFVRRDGRMFHDLVAGTGMIYLWDAQLAKVRHQAMRMERNDSTMSDEDADDELDDLITNDVDDDDDDETEQHSGHEAKQEGQGVLLGRENQVKGSSQTSIDEPLLPLDYATFSPAGQNLDSKNQRTRCFT